MFLLLQRGYFQVLAVSFRGCIHFYGKESRFYAFIGLHCRTIVFGQDPGDTLFFLGLYILKSKIYRLTFRPDFVVNLQYDLEMAYDLRENIVFGRVFQGPLGLEDLRK